MCVQPETTVFSVKSPVPNNQRAVMKARYVQRNELLFRVGEKQLLAVEGKGANQVLTV